MCLCQVVERVVCARVVCARVVFLMRLLLFHERRYVFRLLCPVFFVFLSECFTTGLVVFSFAQFFSPIFTI